MVALARSLRTRWRSEAGAEFVEFALAFPLLMLVVMGIIDFGILFQQYEVITNAAREGARIAVLPNYSAQDAQDRVNEYMTNGGFFLQGGTWTTAVVPVSFNISGKCVQAMRVTVTYPHPYLFLGGIGQYFGAAFGTKTLTATSTMRKELTAAGC